MTPHATRLPVTADAKYHARRRARLVSALGAKCASCGATLTLSRPAGFLEIDHVHGGGSARRSGGHTSREITRLLTLTPEELAVEVRLLCGPCHASVPTTVRFARS